MEKFVENIKKLKIKGIITYKEIEYDRLKVFRNGIYFGIYDLKKQLFVD